MVEIDAVPIFGEIGAFGRWDRIMSPHETMSSPCLDLLCSFDPAYQALTLTASQGSSCVSGGLVKQICSQPRIALGAWENCQNFAFSSRRASSLAVGQFRELRSNAPGPG